MPRVRDFTECLAESMELSDRAAAAVRRRNEERPFESYDELREAYFEEMRILEAGVFTQRDRNELSSLGITD